jgi:hypothetical protein
MRPLSSRWIAVALALSATALAAPDARADLPDAPIPAPVAFADMSFQLFTGEDPECPDQTAPRQRRERRPMGPLAWLFRLDRDHDLERSTRPFAFYLRSPLLSGLYSCPPPTSAGAKPPEPIDECAELTITTAAQQEHTIQVLLPQYEARNVKRLRAFVDDRLEKGQVVTLIMTGGEPFSIRPDDTAEIAAKTCRHGVWND